MSVEHGTYAIGRNGGRHWESDRAIRALKPGNAGRAKGPDFRQIGSRSRRMPSRLTLRQSPLPCTTGPTTHSLSSSMVVFREPGETTIDQPK